MYGAAGAIQARPQLITCAALVVLNRTSSSSHIDAR